MDRDETYPASSEAAPRTYSGKKSRLRVVERGDRVSPQGTSHGADYPFGKKIVPRPVHSNAGSSSSSREGPVGVIEGDDHVLGGDTRAPVPAPGIDAALLSLASLALDAEPDVNVAISTVLTLLADNLDAGAVMLTRVEGEVLHVEHALDRAGLGLVSGTVLPLHDTY